MARTRVDGRWVYGLSPLVVSEPGAVSHHSAAVTAPRLISVVPTYSTVEPTSVRWCSSWPAQGASSAGSPR
jgi:hypothetical protein